MKTKTQKKLKRVKIKNREQVQIAVELVRGGARCLWRIGFEKKISFEIGMKAWWGDGWRVVMVTLTRWDDHGSMVSQEEIAQDDQVTTYVINNL